MATFERIFFSVMDKLQAFGLAASGLGILAGLGFLGVLDVLVILVILGVLACSYIRPARSSVVRSHLFTFSLFHPFTFKSHLFTFSFFHPFTFKSPFTIPTFHL